MRISLSGMQEKKIPVPLKIERLCLIGKKGYGIVFLKIIENCIMALCFKTFVLNNC